MFLRDRKHGAIMFAATFVHCRLPLHSACLVCRRRTAQKQPPAKPIDLNVANVKELQELPGVGAVTAQRIIDMRQKSGRFKRVEDLLAIRGISQKKLDAMRPYVTLGLRPLLLPRRKAVLPARSRSDWIRLERSPADRATG